MDAILTIAKDVSPIGVIFLLVVIVYQLLKGKNLMSLIKGNQEEKYPQLDGFMTAISNLTAQNEVLLENHFKHEIPDMGSALVRIEQKNDKMIEILTQINTKLK